MSTTKTLALSCLLAAATATAGAKDYNYESVPGDPLKARVYTLDNGLKVYMTANGEKPRIQAYIAVRTGSRNDPAETTGLAHYLEHLMFKGTQTFGTTDYAAEKPLLDAIEARYERYRTLTDTLERRLCYREIDSLSQLAARYFIPNEYDKLMAGIGAQGSNAYTSNDVTCYQEDIPANELDNWLKIQADRFENMVIRGFHTELEAVYEEKNMSLTRDFEKAYNALNAKLYPTHPYGTQTTIGTQEHLKNPSITNIKDYFRRYYVPNNMAICLSGDLNPDSAIALIDRHFGSWKADPALSRPEYAAVRQLTAPADTTVVGQEAESLMLGWKFSGAADLQADTLEVMINMLTNGKAGLLETDLEQQMLVQGARAMSDDMADYTSLILYCQPKEGQTLGQLRKVVLDELDKLRGGDFDDELLPAVINNMKFEYYEKLRENSSRADMFVSAFINGRPWATEAGKLDRISKITKRQIVDFARRHLKDNYVCVYKQTGNDTTIKKIDKPQITAIPANRDLQSGFLKEMTEAEVMPIEPRFLDFGRDMERAETKTGVPVLYINNTGDGLFDLVYYYEFGEEDVRDLSLAPDYLEYIGTDTKSAAQVRQDFYSLACSYRINVGPNSLAVTLSGLSENMEQAVAMLDDLLNNAKGDTATFADYVEQLAKMRQDAKTSQEMNASRLFQYGKYGPYNPMRNSRSAGELLAAGPQLLTGMLKSLASYSHTIMYYGPMSRSELVRVMDSGRRLAATPAPVPQGKEFAMEQTPRSEVLIAPYDAKNIYMMQYSNSGEQWQADEAAVAELFNTYFGMGMNSVVFQELREARGLAYSARAFYQGPWRKGAPTAFNTLVITQNDKMGDCISTFAAICDSMPQSEESLEIARQSIMKRLQSERTTRSDIFRAYIAARQLGIDYDINRRIYADLPGVTLDDVTRFGRRQMAGKPFRYIILGNEKDLDMESLGKLGPIKRLTTEEIFGY